MHRRSTTPTMVTIQSPGRKGARQRVQVGVAQGAEGGVTGVG